ncbi:MAG: outer membrane protein transport protein [Acidobacteria bacterium]|nr:outer membrane protein transport protein [Acidobacteriota bacterium]
MRRLIPVFLGVGLAWILAAAPSAGTNGTYLSSYGAEAVGRAGANLAISDRTLGINFNPAGICQLQGNHLSVGASFLAPDMETENLVNGTTAAEDQIFPLPSFAYVRGGNETPWTWGLGFVAQGGMGARYKNLNTFFGTQDEIFSQVRFATVIPTVAYSINDDMALGLAVNLGYGDVAFRFFPETSFFNAQDPPNSFFGVRMEEAGGFLWNARLGWWYRAHPRFSLGVVYQSETESNYEGGATEINFANHPFLGRKVKYESEVEGFRFASQAGIGFALRTTDRLTLALDVKRYFWDQAMDTITVTARNPEVAGAPPEVVLPFVFNWKDQWVFALGGDFRVNERLTLRAGYNYGENPVPDNTLTPLFPANVEHHLAVGATWQVGNRTFEVALQHAFENDQTNGNVDPRVNPFGPGSRVSHQQWLLSFSASWAWARGR